MKPVRSGRSSWRDPGVTGWRQPTISGSALLCRATRACRAWHPSQGEVVEAMTVACSAAERPSRAKTASSMPRARSSRRSESASASLADSRAPAWRAEIAPDRRAPARVQGRVVEVDRELRHVGDGRPEIEVGHPAVGEQEGQGIDVVGQLDVVHGVERQRPLGRPGSPRCTKRCSGTRANPRPAHRGAARSTGSPRCPARGERSSPDGVARDVAPPYDPQAGPWAGCRR